MPGRVSKSIQKIETVAAARSRVSSEKRAGTAAARGSPVSTWSLRQWVESEAGADRHNLMAFAYSVVGVPLVVGLWWLGGSALQLGALAVTLVLAVAALSMEEAR